MLGIEKIRASLGEPPRRFGFLQRRRNRLVVPKWYKDYGDNRFDQHFNDQKLLFQNGKVVWAYTVQANVSLFEPGPTDAPAAVLFSMDPYFDDSLGNLEDLASFLYAFKGADDPPPNVKEFSRIITDEIVAPLNVALPFSLTDGLEVFFTCILVRRKHLPSGFLSASWFPLLADPILTKASMIVPFEYWSAELLKSWSR